MRRANPVTERRFRLFLPVRASLAFLLLAAVSLSAGQAPCGLRGKIVDRASGKPLAGVEIRLAATSFRTQTRASGEYGLSGIPPGVYTLEAELQGYAAEIRKDIVLKSGETAVFDLELAETPARVEEYVSVVGSTLPAKNTAGGNPARITGNEVRTMPGGMEDLSRALKTTLGVSQISDVSNELIVRGGSPWENGFYLDNIPVSDVSHFQNQGNSGGIVGTVEASRIEDIDFFIGGFSAAYGNRLSSIAEIRLKEAARDRIHSRLNLNTAGFGGGVEGPLFNGRGSMSLSLRRSYHDIVAKWIGYGVAPRFGDGLFVLSADLGARHRIEILALAGQSRMDIGMETAVAEGFNNALDYKTGQTTVGIGWRALWADGFSDTSLSYGTFSNDYSLSDVLDKNRYYVADTERRGLTLRNVNTWMMTTNDRLVFGLDASAEREIFDNFFAAHISRWNLPIAETAAAGDHAAARAGVFAEYTTRILKRLAVTLGLRADMHSRSGTASVSPRLSAVLPLSDRWSVHAAYGRYTQPLPLYLLATLAGPDKPGEPIARHLLLGLHYRVADRIHLSLEAYAKDYRRMPLAPQDPAVFVMDGATNFGYYQTYDALVDTGRAEVRGFDAVIRANGRLWAGVAGFTLMRSRFRDLNGVWRDRQNDNRYLVTLLGTYRPNAAWSFSARFQAAGGIPYTPCDPEKSSELQIWIIDPTRINTERYSDYAAVHLRLDRRWTFRRSGLLVYLSVMNALNRKNVLAYAWSKAKNGIVAVYQSPILPEFGIEWSF